MSNSRQRSQCNQAKVSQAQLCPHCVPTSGAEFLVFDLKRARQVCKLKPIYWSKFGNEAISQSLSAKPGNVSLWCDDITQTFQPASGSKWTVHDGWCLVEAPPACWEGSLKLKMGPLLSMELLYQENVALHLSSEQVGNSVISSFSLRHFGEVHRFDPH